GMWPGPPSILGEAVRPYPRTQILYFAFGKSGITYLPASSLTTILANLVGKSSVSAITQTPASGPFGPRTTPPMSSPSMATWSLPPCWAKPEWGTIARISAAAMIALLIASLLIDRIFVLLKQMRDGARRLAYSFPGRRRPLPSLVARSSNGNSQAILLAGFASAAWRLGCLSPLPKTSQRAK